MFSFGMTISFLGVPVDDPSDSSLPEVIRLFSNVQIEDLLSQSMAEYHAAANLDGQPDTFNPSDEPDTVFESESLHDIASDAPGPAPSGEAPPLSSIEGINGKKRRGKRHRQNQRRHHAQSRVSKEQITLPEPPPRTRRRLIIGLYGKPLITKTDFCARFLPMAKAAYVGKRLKANPEDMNKIFSLSELLSRGFQVIKWDGQ
jgi:hypothetical protein